MIRATRPGWTPPPERRKVEAGGNADAGPPTKGATVNRWLILTLACGLTLPAGACSFIDSSVSSSDSIASSSSSFSSSSPTSRETAYRDDVRDYTYAYVISGGDPTVFQTRLAAIAEQHGITNWEANTATYVGIGQGLGKAKVKPVELDAFKQNLSHGDPAKAQEIQRGYEQMAR